MQILDSEKLVIKNERDLFKPTILILSPFLPYPPKDGGRLKMYNMIKTLSSDYDIILLSFLEDEAENRFVAHLKIFCKDVFTVLRRPSSLSNREADIAPEVAKAFYSIEFKEKLEFIIRNYKIDILQVEYTFMSYYVYGIRNIPKILVEHDTSLFSLFSSYERPLKRGRFIRFKDWLKKVRFHKRAYQWFDKIVVFNQEEAKNVKKLVNKVDISVIPIGLDLSVYEALHTQEKSLDLIFVGYFGHFPNIDGLSYFCDKIFPLIQRELPEVSLYVIGSGIKDEIKELSERKNIHLIGEVEDIRSYMAMAKVCIAPLRLGRGLRVKILEAMAMGLPVVSTSVAAKGIRLKNGREIIIEDTPQKFAKAVICLLKNTAFRNELGNNARRVIEQDYDLNKIRDLFRITYNSVIN